MKYVILILIGLSIGCTEFQGMVFKKYFKEANFYTMKETPVCEKYVQEYKIRIGNLPIRVAFRHELPSLRADAFVSECWNKSTACFRSVYRYNQAEQTLAKDFFPLHPENNSDYHNWSYVDQMKYKELKRKADIELLESENEFKNACKRTPLSDFIDKFRGWF